MQRPLKPIDAPIQKKRRHGPIANRQLDWVAEPAKPVAPRTQFTKEMVRRAHEDGISPHELLYTLAVDTNALFDDYIFSAGEYVSIKRHTTLKERMDCLKAILEFYGQKKSQVVEQNGEIRVIHALARPPLAQIELDSVGRLISPSAQTISFDESDEV